MRKVRYKRFDGSYGEGHLIQFLAVSAPQTIDKYKIVAVVEFETGEVRDFDLTHIQFTEPTALVDHPQAD
jgi:hypothetical protein